ncbi:MAG: hypothetical protein HOP35_14295 [Nitrospira sp.]|nr:hypothetical protein [Nitrospira sp.]
MPFEQGRTKTGGRKVGATNRFTGAFREAIQVVYLRLGGHDAFLAWAKENQTEYYKIASRLIPAEVREGGSDKAITVIVQRERSLIEGKPILTDGQTDN